MNNEPVALMTEYGIQPLYEGALQEGMFLYTHPVSQYKAITNTKIEPTVVSYTHPAELTDEEIGQLKGEWYRGNYASFYDLVRAILRKAQKNEHSNDDTDNNTPRRYQHQVMHND